MFKNARQRKGHPLEGTQRYLRYCRFDSWRKIRPDLNAESESATSDPCDVKPRRSVHHTQRAFESKALTLLFSSPRKLSCSDPVTTLETTSSFVMIFYVLTTCFLVFWPPLYPTQLVTFALLCFCGHFLNL